MASALPPAPTPISELVLKYRPRAIANKQQAAALSRPASTRSTLRSAAGGPGPAKYQVPPLTVLALDALVHGFEVQPGMKGVPPKYAAAIAARLPVSLDIRVTAPHVDDESYWRRVCVEAHGWSRAEIAEHGGSWKQMCLERLLARMLEEFGVEADTPPGYEEEFCRPPIDSTHPKWAVLYPKQATSRSDGKPTRERFAGNALEEPSRDDSILASGDSGWPHLETLKHMVATLSPAYLKSYAWATVDKSEYAPPPSSPGGTMGTTSPAGGGDGKRPATVASPTPHMPPVPLPFQVEAEKRRVAAAAATQLEEDMFDSRCSGMHLREYVSPAALESWRKTGHWDASRGGSILTTRYEALTTLLERVAAAGDYVFNLKIEQLPSHIDLQLLFARLPNLTSLHVTYAMRHLGMRYDRGLFGMRVGDARQLSECLRVTDSLVQLALPCNMIDDHLLVELMTGLLDNNTLTHLDLSHNNITSAGVEVLVQLLRKGPCTLATLMLGDNKLDGKAGRHIGRALKKNDSLTEVSLRLNDLGDDGGRALLEGLKHNTTLSILNISSNRLGSATAAVLAQVLSGPECALAQIDASGNRMDEADAHVLCTALASNSTMSSLDLRGNAAISDNSESLQGIARLCHRNELRARASGPLDPLAGLTLGAAHASAAAGSS